MELVQVDIVGPTGVESIGSSTYIIMFTAASASHLKQPYGITRKPDVLAAVRRVVDKMGRPDNFCTDDAKEFTGGYLVGLSDHLAIRREATVPNMPQHNVVAESSTWCAAIADHAARLGILRFYPGLNLLIIKNLDSADGRGSGWSRYAGHPKNLTSRRRQQIPKYGRHTRSSMGWYHR